MFKHPHLFAMNIEYINSIVTSGIDELTTAIKEAKNTRLYEFTNPEHRSIIEALYNNMLVLVKKYSRYSRPILYKEVKLKGEELYCSSIILDELKRVNTFVPGIVTLAKYPRLCGADSNYHIIADTCSGILRYLAGYDDIDERVVGIVDANRSHFESEETVNLLTEELMRQISSNCNSIYARVKEINETFVKPFINRTLEDFENFFEVYDNFYKEFVKVRNVLGIYLTKEEIESKRAEREKS